MILLVGLLVNLWDCWLKQNYQAPYHSVCRWTQFFFYNNEDTNDDNDDDDDGGGHEDDDDDDDSGGGDGCDDSMGPMKTSADEET